jgi:hypothetical protein
VNATFESNPSSVAEFTLLTPFMHNLTINHGNEPPLDPVPYTEYNVQDSSKISDRRLPIDIEPQYVSTEFSNIYLSPVCQLASAQAALCIILDEVRLCGQFDSKAVVLEEFISAEAGLKTARHCVYFPSTIRVSLLLSLGRAMLQMTKYGIPGTTVTATAPAALFSAKEIAIPLEAVLTVGIAGDHPWDTMSRALVQLVDLYCDHSLKHEKNSSERLTLAIGYLDAAIKLSKQKALVRTGSLALSDAQSLDKPITGELSRIATSCGFSSTAEPSVFNKADSGTPVAEDPKAKKGKGAPPPATGGATSSSRTGRDVLALITTILREANPLTMGESEYSLRTDLHRLLKSAFPSYVSEFTTESVPTLENPISIVKGSISAYWTPSAIVMLPDDDTPEEDTPSGLFHSIDVLLILGATKADDDGVGSAALTKVTVPLAAVVSFEREFLELNWKLKEAIAKKNKPINRTVASRFASTLQQAIACLLGTKALASPVTCTHSIDDETQAITATLSFEEQEYSLSVTDNTINSLALLFANSTVTRQMVHDEVCRLLRGVLGFPAD